MMAIGDGATLFVPLDIDFRYLFNLHGYYFRCLPRDAGSAAGTY